MSFRVTDAEDLTFESPGPGTWRLVDDHFPRPLTRYFCTIDGGPMEEGVNDAAARFGWLFERETAIVDRFYYMTWRSIAPENPAVNDEVPFGERLDRLRETYERRAWNRAVEQWDDDWRPSVRERGRELLAVDPDHLADAALVEHLDACRTLAWDAHRHHFETLPPVALAVGDFLAHAADWTGQPEAELLRLLDGSSPASAGLDEELARVEAAITADATAEAVLFGDDPADAIVERLRQRPGAVGEAVEEWLLVAGYRTVSGYDVADAYALEQPAVLVRTLRSAVEEGVDPANDDTDERLADVRELVPAADRDAFDDRLAEARSVYRVRDESSLLALWAQGILRRGLLAAGRRLADRGRLHDPEHVVELTHEELLAALRGGSVPPAEEVASYAEYRSTHDSDDAPQTLGSEPTPSSEPLDEADLPDPAARAYRAHRAFGRAWTWGTDADDEPARGTIDGLAASPGTYEGTARVIASPDDFSAIEEGDVLVAEMTSSAFNVALQLLGAIVTDKGGMLAHPAVVAREFGIPAVVACEDATDRIHDGDAIRVDGGAGEVTFVE